MATRLYFHNAAAGVTGTLPAGEQSSGYNNAGATVTVGAVRSMNTTVGPSVQTVSWTTLANTVAQQTFLRFFASQPLAAQTIPTATGFTLSVAGLVSNTISNLEFVAVIYLWRPTTGALIQLLFDPGLTTTKPGTAATIVTSAPNSIGDIIVASGDILVCEIWRDNAAQTMGTGYTNTLYYDGPSTSAAATYASYLDIAYDLTFIPPTLTQAAYGLYADGTESGSTALVAQNTGYTANLGAGDANLQVRVMLQSTNTIALTSLDDYQLQFEKNASGTWTNVGTGDVVGYNSASLTEGATTTNRLTGGTGSFSGGLVAEDGLVDNVGWSANNYAEMLYSITLKAAGLANGDTLRFRVLRNGATTGMTYSQTPTISINKAPHFDLTATDTASPSDSANAVVVLLPPGLRVNSSKAEVQSTSSSTNVQSLTGLPANCVIALSVLAEQNGTGEAMTQGVTSSPTLTWTRSEIISPGNNSGSVGTSAEMWTASFPAGGALTITTTPNALANTSGWRIRTKPYIITDSGGNIPLVGVTARNHSASGVPSLAFTGTASGSYLVAGSIDWAEVSPSTATAGTGTTIDSSNDNGASTDYRFRSTSTVSGGSQTISLTAPTGQNYNAAGVEIKAAGAAATATDTSTPSDTAVRTLPLTRTGTDSSSPSDTSSRTRALVGRTAADTASPSDAVVATVHASGVPYTGFGAGANPGGVVFQSDNTVYTVGTAFYTTRTGQYLRSGRIWIDAAASTSNLNSYGLHFQLWSINPATGFAQTMLAQTASVTFPGLGNAGVAGWAEINFASDIPLTANTNYLIACTIPGLVLAFATNYFATATVAAPSGAAGLFFPQDVPGIIRNGQYGGGATYQDYALTAVYQASFNDVDVLMVGPSLLTATATDSSSPSDTAVRTLPRTRTATDTASPSDTVVRALPKARTAADTASPTDIAVRTLPRTRTAADSSVPSDAAGGPGTRARAAADVASPSETVTRTQTKIRTVTDTAAPADTAAKALGYSRTATDTGAPGDSVSRGLLTRVRSVVDASVPTDTAGSSGHGQVSASDIAVPSDTVTRILVLIGRSAAMSTAPLDTVGRSMLKVRTGTDATAPGDVSGRSGVVQTRTSADASTPSDGVIRSLVRSRTATDLTTPSDLAVSTARGQNTASDTSVPSDVAQRGLVLVTRAATMSTAPSDVAVRNINRPRGAADTATPVDTSTRISASARVATDLRGPSDVAVRTRALLRTATDISSPSDSANGTVALVLPSISTIPKDFTNPVWKSGGTAGAVTVTPSKVTFPAGMPGSHGSFIQTDPTAYALTGSSIFVKVTPSLAGGFATIFIYLTDPTGRSIDWEIDGGVGAMFSSVGVTGGSLGTWDPASPYLQIRESGGTVYFERSATGSPGSWALLGQTPKGTVDVTNLKVRFEADDTTSVTVFENLNTVGGVVQNLTRTATDSSTPADNAMAVMPILLAGGAVIIGQIRRPVVNYWVIIGGIKRPVVHQQVVAQGEKQEIVAYS